MYCQTLFDKKACFPSQQLETIFNHNEPLIRKLFAVQTNSFQFILIQPTLSLLAVGRQSINFNKINCSLLAPRHSTKRHSAEFLFIYSYVRSHFAEWHRMSVMVPLLYRHGNNSFSIKWANLFVTLILRYLI
jgi:hypothetical protein